MHAKITNSSGKNGIFAIKEHSLDATVCCTMTFLLAPDSYKGCLSAKEVTASLSEGIREAIPGAEVLELPLPEALKPETARKLLRTCGSAIYKA